MIILNSIQNRTGIKFLNYHVFLCKSTNTYIITRTANSCIIRNYYTMVFRRTPSGYSVKQWVCGLSPNRTLKNYVISPAVCLSLAL